MKIDIKTEECLFIVIGEFTSNINNSTGENILQRWLTIDTSNHKKYLELLNDGTILIVGNLKNKAA